MTKKQDVKRDTVERNTRDLINRGVPREQAKQIAVDSAERVNRQRRGEK